MALIHVLNDGLSSMVEFTLAKDVVSDFGVWCDFDFGTASMILWHLTLWMTLAC
jgi:hypothetical protein